MNESIRRARDVKRAEIAQSKVDEPVEKIDEGRRWFLRGAIASAAMAVMPALPDTAHAEKLDVQRSIEEREAIIANAIEKTRRAMNTPDVLAARKGEGRDLLMKVFRTLQFPITPEFIKGTKYDMSGVRKRHAVQIAYRWGRNQKLIVELISNKAEFKKETEAGYGNGIFFGTAHSFLTAKHVAEDSQNRPDPRAARDIAILHTGALRARPEQVVKDDPTLTNNDIDGAFVSVEGIDPDTTGDFEGYKSYPGVALKLSRGFIDKLYYTTPVAYRERLCKSFAIILPPGEGTGATAAQTPGSGMSGSPVWTLRNGERVLAGIMHMTTSERDPATGRTIDIAFFHGIEDVREEVASHIRSGA